jgi:hypothetical protein
MVRSAVVKSVEPSSTMRISNPSIGGESAVAGLRHNGRSALTISSISCPKLPASFLAGTTTDKYADNPDPCVNSWFIP